MENKVNYYLKSLEELALIAEQTQKPSLLMHVCCGPCSTHPLEFLCPYFNVTLFYNNSNIYPQEEYQRRLDELKRFLVLFETDYGYKVNLIVTPYDNQKYNLDLEPYKDEREGQNRCYICFNKRMSQAYDYAELNHYDYFTTVMSISSHKNSQILNQIGEMLAKSHPNCKYFFSDFKKNKGMDYARIMSEYYKLYRQDYCGCIYSYNKRK